MFEQITSAENLFLAWDEFHRGKAAKPDVMEFERNLEENVFNLQRELLTGSYKHGQYHAFYIHDPKQRLIHKANVRDRLVHHAVFRILNPVFEPVFIANSFSCRVGKGTHKGVKSLARISRRVSRNNKGRCFALKCDIYKFFANISRTKLLNMLSIKIGDEKTLTLLKEIIDSFSSRGWAGRGLPIGNLTSQLFANIYMNEFDQFVKQQLKVKYYLRYTDDFVVVSSDKYYLETLLPRLEQFLAEELMLRLHPNKIIIRKYIAGVDFLGYVVFPHHIKLRTKTRRRILAKINSQNLPSYLGVCSHANTYWLQESIKAKVYKAEMLE